MAPKMVNGQLPLWPSTSKQSFPSICIHKHVGLKLMCLDSWIFAFNSISKVNIEVTLRCQKRTGMFAMSKRKVQKKPGARKSSSQIQKQKHIDAPPLGMVSRSENCIFPGLSIKSGAQCTSHFSELQTYYT